MSACPRDAQIDNGGSTRSNFKKNEQPNLPKRPQGRPCALHAKRQRVRTSVRTASTVITALDRLLHLGVAVMRLFSGGLFPTGQFHKLRTPFDVAAPNEFIMSGIKHLIGIIYLQSPNNYTRNGI